MKKKVVRLIGSAEPRGSLKTRGGSTVRHLKVVVSVVGGLGVLALLLLAFSAPIVAQEGTVVWSASAAPVDWPMTATIVVSSEAFAATSGMCRAPSCEAIVADISGSMLGAWYTATTAVVEYTEIISQSARAAYIVFNDAAQVLLPMGSPDPVAVEQALAGITPSGWTNLAEAIQLSRSELATCGLEAKRRGVYIGDGAPTDPPPDPFAAALQQADLSHGEGNQHYTILVNENPTQQNLDLFEDIALGPDGSWEGTFQWFSDWDSFYISSTQAVEAPCAGMPPGYYGRITSITAPAGVTVTGDFSWTVLAGGQVETGSLQAVAAAPGIYSVEIEYEWYSPKQGGWVTSSLPVQVEFRTPDYNPQLSLTKLGPETAQVGQTVVYTIVVSNVSFTPTGVGAAAGDGSPINTVIVTDSIAVLTYIGGDDGDGQLEFLETWIYTAEYTIQDGDPNPLVNEATATGLDLGGELVIAANTHSIVLVPPPPEYRLCLPLVLRNYP